MDKLTHIGLDVHKDTIAVAVLRPGGTEVDERVIPNTPEAIRKLLSRRDPAEVRVCYEAGPSGYDTHRTVASLGFGCDVIAPSLIPRRSVARVKTDRIDARNLGRLHRAGELTCVRVQTSAEEAVRDLIRVREEVKSDRRIARSWAAQCRLHGTFRRISARKNARTAVVATARELAGFVWGLSTGNMTAAR